MLPYNNKHTGVLFDYGDDLILCSPYYAVDTSLGVNKKRVPFWYYFQCACALRTIYIIEYGNASNDQKKKNERKEITIIFRCFILQTHSTNTKSYRPSFFWLGCISTITASFSAFVKIHLIF